MRSLQHENLRLRSQFEQAAEKEEKVFDLRVALFFVYQQLGRFSQFQREREQFARQNATVNAEQIQLQRDVEHALLEGLEEKMEDASILEDLLEKERDTVGELRSGLAALTQELLRTEETVSTLERIKEGLESRNMEQEMKVASLGRAAEAGQHEVERINEALHEAKRELDSLLSERDQVLASRTALEEEIAQMRAYNAKNTETLNGEITRLRISEEKSRAELEASERHVKILQEENCKLDRNNGRLGDSLRALESEKNELLREVESVEQRAIRLEAVCSESTQQLAAKSSEITSLQCKVVELENEQALATTALGSPNEQITNLQAEIETLIAMHKQEFEKFVADHKEEMDRLLAKQGDAQTTNHNLSATITELESKISGLESEKIVVTAALESARSENASLNVHLKAETDRLLTDLKEQLDRLRTEQQTMMSHRDTLSATIGQLEKKVAELESEQTISAAALNSAHSENTSLNDKIGHLQAEMENKAALHIEEVTRLLAEQETIRSDTDALSATIRQLEEKNAVLESEQTLSAAALGSARSENKSLNDTIAHLQAEAEKLMAIHKEESSRLLHEKEQAHQHVRDLGTENDQVLESMNKLRATLDEAVANQQAAAVEYQQEKIRLLQEKEQMSESTESFSKSLEAMKDANRQLEESLKAAWADRDMLSAEVDELREQLLVTENENDGRAKEIQDQLNIIEGQKEKILALEGEASSLIASIARLNTSMEFERRKLGSVENLLREEQATNEKKAMERKRMVNEIKELNTKLNRKEMENSELQHLLSKSEQERIAAMDALQIEIAELRRLQSDAQARSCELQSSLQASASKLEQREAEIVQIQSQAEARSLELESLLAASETKLKQREAEVSSSAALLKEFEEKHCALKVSAQSQHRELESKNDQLSMLALELGRVKEERARAEQLQREQREADNGRIRDFEQERIALKEQLQEMGQNLLELNRSLSASQSRTRAAEEELHRLKMRSEEYIRNVEREIQMKSAIIEELKAKLADREIQYQQALQSSTEKDTGLTHHLKGQHQSEPIEVERSEDAKQQVIKSDAIKQERRASKRLRGSETVTTPTDSKRTKRQTTTATKSLPKQYHICMSGFKAGTAFDTELKKKLLAAIKVLGANVVR